MHVHPALVTHSRDVQVHTFDLSLPTAPRRSPRVRAMPGSASHTSDHGLAPAPRGTDGLSNCCEADRGDLMSQADVEGVECSTREAGAFEAIGSDNEDEIPRLHGDTSSGTDLQRLYDNPFSHACDEAHMWVSVRTTVSFRMAVVVQMCVRCVRKSTNTVQCLISLWTSVLIILSEFHAAASLNYVRPRMDEDRFVRVCLQLLAAILAAMGPTRILLHVHVHPALVTQSRDVQVHSFDLSLPTAPRRPGRLRATAGSATHTSGQGLAPAPRGTDGLSNCCEAHRGDLMSRADVEGV